MTVDGEFVCCGSQVFFGKSQDRSVTVLELPQQVYDLMTSSATDMIELHSHVNPDIPAYVDRHEIIAVSPRWARVPVGS